MRAVPFAVVTTVAAMVLAGCSLLGKEVPKARPLRFPKEEHGSGARQPRKVGTVLLVNAEGRFVLIESIGIGAPQPGVALKTMRAGVETGVLTVSAERRGRIFTADIVTGQPARGDDVMQ